MPLVSISNPYSDDERSFLHYTSHSSERLLKAYQSTKGKISVPSKEDLLTLQTSTRADVLHTGNKNFVFDFSAREIEVTDIGTNNLRGWFEPANPGEATKGKSLRSIVSGLLGVLETLSQEQIQESTLKARALLSEAYSSRTHEKSSDFEISESSIFSDGDVEINVTDIISGKSRFIFAENSAQLETLLRELPANQEDNYFILGYPSFYGFYSMIIKIEPSLEITAKQSLVCVPAFFKTKGDFAVNVGGHMFNAGYFEGSNINIRAASILSIPLKSFSHICRNNGTKVLIIPQIVISSFNRNQPEMLPGVREFLRKRFSMPELIIGAS